MSQYALMPFDSQQTSKHLIQKLESNSARALQIACASTKRTQELLKLQEGRDGQLQLAKEQILNAAQCSQKIASEADAASQAHMALLQQQLKSLNLKTIELKTASNLTAQKVAQIEQNINSLEGQLK